MNKSIRNFAPIPTLKLWVIVLLISTTALLLACSDNDSPVAPTDGQSASPTPIPLATSETSQANQADQATNQLPTPPIAILSNGTAQSEAALGSYCWHFDLTSTIECDNVFDISAPTVPLVTSPGQKLTIHLPNKPMMLVTMRVLQWQTSDAQVKEGYTAIALDAPVLASGDLEPQATIEWEAPPMTGEYMLDLMSVYENEGHIGYGWHILVE